MRSHYRVTAAITGLGHPDEKGNCMMKIFILIICILLIFGVFLFGRKTAQTPKGYLRAHSRIAKFVIWGYMVFAGCFTFPIASEPYPLDYTKAYLLIASYGIIGLAFAYLYGKHKYPFVFLSVLLLTTSGLACRWVLEYGEVSNTYNFTMFNIVSYIILVPIYTVLAYHLGSRYLIQKTDHHSV